MIRRAAILTGVSTLLGLLSLACVWIAARVLPLPPDYLGQPSTVVRYADGSPAHVFLAPDDAWRMAADLEGIDPAYIEALFAFEDQRFLSHHGVDPIAVLRAVAANMIAGEVVSGASTLTMQLARMREPKARTVLAKLKEAFRALQLEARYSKTEILEAYLTHAPFGGNRQGIEVASRAFFGHGPAHLSASEIATLIAIPQRPTPRMPSPGNLERLLVARNHVRSTLEQAGVLDPSAPDEPAPTRILALPREIPHLAHQLRAAQPKQLEFRTTLRRETQRLVRRLMDHHRPELLRLGIHHGAAVVLEHGSGELHAMVGSLDFWSDEPGAQIAGFFVPRSPGSTLKPLVYARALEDGRLLPETLLPDVPRVYGGYRPQNYDGRFDGAVPAREALARSLNLPFIDLVHEIGLERFVGELVTTGAAHIDDTPGRLGLSVVLGSIGLTPVELAQLYGALSSDGQVRQARWLTDAPSLPPIRLWSEAAARLTRDALDDRDRPDFPHRSRLRGVPPGVYWKTGTSFAHRDAWTVGGDRDRTVAVWLGNFDNRPSPHLVGAERAAPLFFDVMEGLRSGQPQPVAEPISAADPGLSSVQICTITGQRAGPACTHTRSAIALAHRVPTETCSVHVEHWVSEATGLRVHPACAGGHPMAKRTFEVWPADVLAHLGPGVRSLPPPPAPDPRCSSASVRPPRILSPTASTRLLVPGLAASAQEVPLSADGEGTLRWFVDGHYLGTAGPGERLWWTPAAGRHHLLVMDERGRKHRRELEVR